MSPEAAPLLDRSVASVPPPPRWARLAAHAVPLVVLPSTLWRLALVVGISVGYTDAVLRSDYDIPGSGYLVLPLISILQEAAALLTLGLVNDWGLVVPRWIPFLGGKHVATWAAVVPAALGALVLTLVTFSQLVIWDRVADKATSQASTAPCSAGATLRSCFGDRSSRLSPSPTGYDDAGDDGYGTAMD
jgi:hypothetical protein